MPIKRKSGEDKDAFISRCMIAEAGSFPDEKQRYAVCMGYLQDCNTSVSKSSMAQKFVDSAAIGAVKRTREGYVTARARAVRSGVQTYRARELGDAAIAAGFGADDMVMVMRPEGEVFRDGSAATFSHVPVTLEHPKELVDADNWKDYAVGEVGSKIMRDGEFLALDLILKDAAAIAAFDSGKRELSAGYTADIEFVDSKDGYDAVMSNIRINHLALVDKGRAGSQARIGDADQWGAAPLTTEKGPEMEMKAVAIGDKAVQVAATDADTLIKMIADKDTAIGELKAKLADAESKILDEDAIAKLVKDRADAMARREAVKAKFGDEAVKDASDAEIMGMFKVIDKAPAADETTRAALGDAAKSAAQMKDNGQSAYEKRLANAWKGE